MSPMAHFGFWVFVGFALGASALLLAGWNGHLCLMGGLIVGNVIGRRECERRRV